jgi:hypothetical protein
LFTLTRSPDSRRSQTDANLNKCWVLKIQDLVREGQKPAFTDVGKSIKGKKGFGEVLGSD